MQHSLVKSDVCLQTVSSVVFDDTQHVAAGNDLNCGPCMYLLPGVLQQKLELITASDLSHTFAVKPSL